MRFMSYDDALLEVMDEGAFALRASWAQTETLVPHLKHDPESTTLLVQVYPDGTRYEWDPSPADRAAEDWTTFSLSDD